MKAERRHELQTNALAQWLNKVIRKVQPYANMIAWLAVAAVAVVLAVTYLSTLTTGRQAGTWDAYFQADAIEEVEQRVRELERVAEDYPGSPAGLWAQLMAADARLVRGTNASYRDHLAGEDDLEKAKSNLLAVLNGAERLPKAQGETLKIRATWCLARTYEALADRENALEQYEKLAREWPDSALAQSAADHARYLRGLDDWFEWYVSVDPTKITPTPRQGRGLPPGHPAFTQPQPGPYDDLPDEIDLTVPGPLDLPGLDDEIDLGVGGEPPADVNNDSLQP